MLFGCVCGSNVWLVSNERQNFKTFFQRQLPLDVPERLGGLGRGPICVTTCVESPALP